MNRNCGKPTILLILWAACTTLLPAQDDARRIAPAGPGRRSALVIGNDAYSWKPLRNAVNDARALAGVLPDVGFRPPDITLVTNTTLRQLQRSAREFIEKLRPEDVALVYYSGHGIEVRGENFLIPVDFPANATELEVQDEAYSAQQLLRNLESSPARVRLLILDACRDNPLRATRSTAGGLARMEGQGTLIVFATSPGKTASDNPGASNGLFTQHLLRGMRTPGVPVDQMIKQVARAVVRESSGRQTPAMYGLMLEDFAFVPAANAAPTMNTVDAARDAWELAKDSGNREMLQSVVREFPDSQYAKLATVKLAGMVPAVIRSEPVPVQPAIKTRVNPKDGLTYVWIPPGKFMMGCSPGDHECDLDEKPPREVEIGKGFWLGETEVTQAAWKRVMGGNNPSRFKGDHRPVENISQDDAKRYCAAIGGRLPTEAEWEYAARAGSTSARYGDLESIGWYGGNSRNQSHEVKQKQPNGWGLFDMLGNVSEWVDGERNLRGGSWLYIPRVLRVSNRNRYKPDIRVDINGARCVVE